VARARAHTQGPVATLPGFEMLADGGSRLFVELTQSIAVEEKRASRTVTYVLKGAHVDRRNNENALVTVHFNTPVTRARLLPSGRDLVFIVDLRADATPSWKLVNAKDNSAILQIDFPKGSFLPANGEADDSLGGAPPSAQGSTSSAAPAKRTPHRRRTPKPSPDQGPAPEGGS
jgi:hypothetical protein